MTNEEKILYNQVKELTKKVNQRLSRLQQYSNRKESFASKELMDRLSASTLNAKTKSSRVSLKSDFTLNQLRAIQKAEEDFLKRNTSKVTGAKKFKKYIENIIGHKISVASASKILIASDNYEWIYNFYDSEIWNTARESKEQNWSFETFLNTVVQGSYVLEDKYNNEIEKDDVELQIRIFYDYIMKE